MSDPKKPNHLLLQLVDQLIALALLLIVWLNRTALGPNWTKGLILLALALSLADYIFLGRRNKQKK